MGRTLARPALESFEVRAGCVEWEFSQWVLSCVWLCLLGLRSVLCLVGLWLVWMQANAGSGSGAKLCPWRLKQAEVCWQFVWEAFACELCVRPLCGMVSEASCLPVSLSSMRGRHLGGLSCDFGAGGSSRGVVSCCA